MIIKKQFSLSGKGIFLQNAQKWTAVTVIDLADSPKSLKIMHQINT